MISEARHSDRAPRRVEGWRFPAMVAVALLPAIATYALVHLQLDAALGDLVPEIPNDQTGYWHYILSFSNHGLDTGYYSPDEHPAALSFFRYDLSGPLYPAIYGAFASVFGWGLSSGILFNLAFVGLGLAMFIYASRLDRLQTTLVALLAISFGPLLLYIPTNMQESFQQSVAIALALVFSALISRDGDLPTRFKAAGFAAIAFVSLIRFSWALLLVPFMLLALPPRSNGRLLANLAASAALIAAILALFAASTSPGGNSVLTTLDSLPDRPGHTLSTVLSDSRDNLEELLDPTSTDSGAVPAAVDVVAVQAWQIVGLALIALLAGTGVLARWAGVGPSSEDRVARREWLFHAYNLGGIVVASVVLYLPNGYYRVLGAHLLLSLLVMVRFRRIVPVAVVIASSLVMAPSFLNLYDAWTPNFRFDKDQLEDERQRVARHIRYQADAPSPWCNTLLLPVEDYDYRVTLIPAGIGISYLLNEDFQTIDLPLKSRYVLLDDGDVAPPASVKATLRPVARFSFGRLYTNPASPCESAEPGGGHAS